MLTTILVAIGLLLNIFCFVSALACMNATWGNRKTPEHHISIEPGEPLSWLVVLILSTVVALLTEIKNFEYTWYFLGIAAGLWLLLWTLVYPVVIQKSTKYLKK